ncbi:unnamed protein product [Scytosiphon promiscuus]
MLPHGNGARSTPCDQEQAEERKAKRGGVGVGVDGEGECKNGPWPCEGRCKAARDARGDVGREEGRERVEGTPCLPSLCRGVEKRTVFVWPLCFRQEKRREREMRGVGRALEGCGRRAGDG